MVDDAIVVVEAVQAKFDEGYQSAVLAADDAMKGVSSAILTSTIIFMAVFFPVAMMGGTSGAFYTQFGITMAVAVGISAVNAFTLSPALCALLLKPYIDEQGNTKNNFAARFRKAFNAVFDRLSRRYVRGVMFIIHRRWLLWSIIGISFGLLVLLVNVTKTGLIPEEDTGTVMVSMNTKPGTSMAQTSKVMERINSRLDSIGEIEYSGAVAGFSFSGSGPSQAMYFVTLKDWEQRKGEGQSVNDVIGKIYAATSDIPDATVFAMSPPMIAGYGMGNGFELYLQDKAGGNIAAFKEEADKFVEALSQRPEIGEVYSSFATDYPQYWVDIDAAKCEQSGCVARRCAFHIVGLLYRTICFRLQPVLQALPCDHAGSGGISCECGIPAPHVCACHRWRHVAFEPVRAPDQDQRPVRPHPFQPVQRHLD